MYNLAINVGRATGVFIEGINSFSKIVYTCKNLFVYYVPSNEVTGLLCTYIILYTYTVYVCSVFIRILYLYVLHLYTVLGQFYQIELLIVFLWQLLRFVYF